MTPNTKVAGTRPIKDLELARAVDPEMEDARKRREARERTDDRQSRKKESASNNGTNS